jgi:hypothetical protein
LGMLQGHAWSLWLKQTLSITIIQQYNSVIFENLYSKHEANVGSVTWSIMERMGYKYHMQVWLRLKDSLGGMSADRHQESSSNSGWSNQAENPPSIISYYCEPRSLEISTLLCTLNLYRGGGRGGPPYTNQYPTLIDFDYLTSTIRLILSPSWSKGHLVSENGIYIECREMMKHYC